MPTAVIRVAKHTRQRSAAVPSLTWDITSYHDHRLITVDGRLDTPSNDAFRAAVVACLADHPHGVLVNLAGMTVVDPSVLDVFTAPGCRPAPETDPGGRVLICDASPDTVAVLRAAGLGHLTFYAGTEQARLELDHRRSSLAAIHEELLPVISCGRRAREIVFGACVRWEQPDLIMPATLIANELAVNVAEHAHTMMTLSIALQAEHLYIGVRDGSTTQPVLSPGDPDKQTGGWGLHMVNRLAAAWGVRPNAHGKTVWAQLMKS
jgi:anti-anti-sigma regulatory factor